MARRACILCEGGHDAVAVLSVAPRQPRQFSAHELSAAEDGMLEIPEDVLCGIMNDTSFSSDRKHTDTACGYKVIPGGDSNLFKSNLSAREGRAHKQMVMYVGLDVLRKREEERSVAFLAFGPFRPQQSPVHACMPVYELSVRQ